MAISYGYLVTRAVGLGEQLVQRTPQRCQWLLVMDT
jgi:hypothetical protein